MTNHIHPSNVPKNFVRTLRKSGTKVRTKHFRWVNALAEPNIFYLEHVTKENHKQFAISSNGGLTRVELTMPDGRELKGEALCAPEDTYNKRLGVYLAVQRAFGKVTNKPIRRFFDAEYDSEGFLKCPSRRNSPRW